MGDNTLWSEGLSFDQRRIVSHASGSARVVAGPGTGKTHCLTQRVTYLLEEVGAAPESIYVITFTRAAAVELEERLQKKFEGTDTELPWIGTLHSFALRTLVRHSEQSEVVMPLRILDDFEENEVIFPELAHKIGVGRDEIKRAKRAYEDRWDNRNPEHKDWLKIENRREFEEGLSNLRQFYGFTLRGGLIYQLAELIDAEPLLASQLGIKYLLVDEYQDLNACDQYVLSAIKRFGADLFIVGDDNQSIYDFRSASPDGIRNFASEHPGSGDYSLDACYRCPQLILDTAKRLVANKDNNVNKLYAVDTQTSGSIYSLQFNSHTSEATAIAAICEEYVTSGVQARDISILLSRKSLSSEIELSMAEQGLPVTVVSSESPLDKEPERLIYCLILLTKDRTNSVALRTWLGLQSRIGKEAIGALRDFCILRCLSLWDGLEVISTDPSLVPRFGATVKTKFELLKSVLTELTNVDGLSGFLQFLRSNANSLAIDVSGFRFFERIAAKKGIQTVDELLELFRLRDVESERQLEANAIRIMTMHKAKGLSSRIVIIPAMEDELMPGQHDSDDRRRLMYVAVTRSSDTLIFTHARKRPGQQSHLGRGGGSQSRSRSRYLKEMGVRSDIGDEFLKVIPKRLSNMKSRNKQQAGFANGHALVVGIANYTHTKRLPDAVLNDAKDLASALRNPELCGYPDDQVRLLLDDAASKTNILNGLTWLAEVAKDDSTVIVFFSGHGYRDKNNLAYLLPYDSNLLSESEITAALSSIQSSRLLVMFDACHAAGTAELKGLAHADATFKAGLPVRMYERLAEGRGRVILASCREDEVSRVSRGMRNSLFSHFLLEALRGKSNTKEDNLIRVFDVIHHVCEEVPSKQHDQHPVYKMTGENSFPIALKLGGKKSGIVQSTRDMEHVNDVSKKRIREVLCRVYSLGELEILCSDISETMEQDGIKYPVNLDRVGGRGAGIETIAFNIIEYLDRKGYLDYLTDALRDHLS